MAGFHSKFPDWLAVIVAVPTPRFVTSPEELTVATEGFEQV
jgi:hypothetical protein